MMTDITTSNMISCIFRRHAARLHTFGADTDLTRYAMLAALDELAEAMQQNSGADAELARIERVLEAHDSALFADVASGRTPLATAIDALIVNESAAFAALSEDIMQANADRVDLRNQLAQMDADNARLSQELRTLRSWVTAPKVDATTNGVTDPAAATITGNGKTRTASELLRQATLSDAANDYWIGLDAARWTWRHVPKSIRLELVRHVISTTPNGSQSEFDAARPVWMATASSHVQTFATPWSILSDLSREIEVAA